MGSRDSVQKGQEENLSNNSKATDLETVIVISHENLPIWGVSASTSSGQVDDLNHMGKEIAPNDAPNDAPMKQETMVQLATQGEAGASDLRLVNVHGEDEMEQGQDPIGLPKMSFTRSDGGKTCVINVKCAVGEDCGGEAKICRICHLDSDEVASKIRMDFVELGCSCKGELGYAHLSCAATWFHQKGNRLCEICGKTAENVTVTISDHRFMEQWNENRLNGEEANSSERDARCWQGQPCCNLLLACLVMSFVIPWLLRIDMF